MDKETKELEIIQDDLGDFAGTRGGKLWLRNVIVNCGIMQHSFTGNSTTFFNEGRRDVALSILKDVKEANPEAYASVIKDIEL